MTLKPKTLEELHESEQNNLAFLNGIRWQLFNTYTQSSYDILGDCTRLLDNTESLYNTLNKFITAKSAELKDYEKQLKVVKRKNIKKKFNELITLTSMREYAKILSKASELVEASNEIKELWEIEQKLYELPVHPLSLEEQEKLMARKMELESDPGVLKIHKLSKSIDNRYKYKYSEAQLEDFKTRWADEFAANPGLADEKIKALGKEKAGDSGKTYGELTGIYYERGKVQRLIFTLSYSLWVEARTQLETANALGWHIFLDYLYGLLQAHDRVHPPKTSKNLGSILVSIKKLLSFKEKDFIVAHPFGKFNTLVKKYDDSVKRQRALRKKFSALGKRCKQLKKSARPIGIEFKNNAGWFYDIMEKAEKEIMTQFQTTLGEVRKIAELVREDKISTPYTRAIVEQAKINRAQLIAHKKAIDKNKAITSEKRAEGMHG